MQFYTLDSSGNPVLELDMQKWARWFEAADLHVADTYLKECRVSTVFLGHGPDSPNPCLWETAVLGGLLDQVKDRCAGNRDQAQAMHDAMVERVRNFMR